MKSDNSVDSFYMVTVSSSLIIIIIIIIIINERNVIATL